MDIFHGPTAWIVESARFMLAQSLRACRDAGCTAFKCIPFTASEAEHHMSQPFRACNDVSLLSPGWLYHAAYCQDGRGMAKRRCMCPERRALPTHAQTAPMNMGQIALQPQGILIMRSRQGPIGLQLTLILMDLQTI